jgi:hypothetical protein
LDLDLLTLWWESVLLPAGLLLNAGLLDLDLLAVAREFVLELLPLAELLLTTPWKRVYKFLVIFWYSNVRIDKFRNMIIRANGYSLSESS